jgi:hypothetical protein
MKNTFTTIFGAALATLSMGYTAQRNDTQYDSNTQPQTQVTRDVTPSAGPRVENGADVVISADFIYWQATQNGLEYAVNFVNGGESVSQGTTHNPKFTFNPGFKVGLGLQLGHDGWDVMAQYSWYNSSDSTDRTVNSDSSETFVTQFPAQNTIGGFTVPLGSPSISSASTRWGMRYNDIDFEIGRNYFISQYLTLRPFSGLKAAWINQDWHTPYYLYGSDYNWTIDQNQKSFGIGLRTGMNGAWEFCKNFSIYGNTAFSVLSTRFKNQYSETDYATIDSVGELYANLNSVLNTIQPVIELGMGVSYDYWFNDDMYHFGISAGWEMQYWNNMNHFFGYSTDEIISRTGDLSIQGLDVKFRFDF